MQSLTLILSCLIAAPSLACIRMVPTDPGIPATTVKPVTPDPPGPCKMCKDNLICGQTRLGMCKKVPATGACGVREVTVTCSGNTGVEYRAYVGVPVFSAPVGDRINGTPNVVIKLTCNPE
ncbi:hypothetical protein PENTCL1PPCAC_29703, partial [Pristionchus entomophagus]